MHFKTALSYRWQIQVRESLKWDTIATYNTVNK